MMMTITSLLQRQKKKAILTIMPHCHYCCSIRFLRPMTMTMSGGPASRWPDTTPSHKEEQQQQLRQSMMVTSFTTTSTSTTANSCRFFSSNHRTTTNEPSIQVATPTVVVVDDDDDDEKSNSSNNDDNDLFIAGQSTGTMTKTEQQQQGEVQEAEIVSEKTTATTTQEAEEENDDVSDVDDDEEEDLLLGDDYFGSTPNEKAYQKVIDMARLTAEVAYQRNNAMVGALAEAGGEEGAAERWLLGFVTLIQQHLPQWWWRKQKNDNIDVKNNDTEHRDSLLALANNRRGDYFIKRCIDPLVLKKRMGAGDYAVADVVAFEILRRVAPSEQEKEVEEEFNTNKNQFFPLSQEAIDGAKAIWGEETMTELSKMTEEELEMEQEMKQAEKQGLLKKVEMEKGDWWGTATHEAPDQAYQRLIDAARHGSMIAYEQNSRYIGAVADAVQATGGNDVSVDDYMNMDDDDDDDDDEEEEDIDADIVDDSDDDEKDAEKDEINKEDSTADTDNKGDSKADDMNMDEEKEKESNEEDTTAADSVYDPKELGPNAKSHFEQFLQEMKKAKGMPPWWNEEHEAAMWQLASDKEGKHFLGYPMDKDDLKESYDDGARRKIAMLAEAAAADMDDPEQPLLGGMDALKGMEGIESNGDFMSDADDLRSTEEGDTSSKRKDDFEQ